MSVIKLQLSKPRAISIGVCKDLQRLLPVFVFGLGLMVWPRVALAQRPLGIDVSSYQANVNWVSVKNSGVSFAWAKATEGTGYFDAYFNGNMTNAKAAGVLIGAYHFARYDNIGTAGADADAAYYWNHVKNFIKGGGTYLMPALDLEPVYDFNAQTSYYPDHYGYTKTTLTQWVNRWCQDIVNYAAASNVTVKPIIYTGAYFSNPWLDSTATQWPVWLANYNGQNPQTGGPSSTSIWPTWNVWQYSSTTQVPGVSGNCDADVFNGTMAQLIDLLVIGGGTNPPSISSQPANAYVPTNGTATFTVVAASSLPLHYQWQKNSNNIANGGHYSGCTTNTLTVTGADITDVASYRCVVTNSYGSITSSNATLSLIVSCEPNALVNANFEGGNIGGVAIGWTSYEANGPTTKVWSIQTASPAEGSQYQQIQAYNAAHTGSAGVRQDVTGCTVGATYQIAGWYRSNSDSGRARVRVSPSASTDWSTAIDLNPVADYGSTTVWATFSGTVVASGPSMTLWLDGRTIAGTSAKVGCFDAVTVTCAGAPVPLRFQSVTRPAQNQTQLLLTGKSNSTVTILRSSNLVNWVAWTNVVNPNGTLQITDTAATNARTYYRATSP